MKLSQKILVISKWLENSNNELLIEAEDNEQCLNILATSFLAVSDFLKKTAEEVQEIEPAEQVELTPEKFEEIAAVAAAFDESGDELLQKQASVLDEILLSFSAPKDYIFNFKKAENDRIDVLKKKYKDTKEELDQDIGVKEALDVLKSNDIYEKSKEVRPLQYSLSTRVCPDHAGAQMSRVDENVFQCSLDHKLYDFGAGYTLLDGTKVPGGSVSEQTPKYHENSHQLFDTRSQRMGNEHS